MNRSARLAGFPDLFALQHLDMRPLGGPPAGLESECSPPPLSLLAMLLGWGRHKLFVLEKSRQLDAAVHLTCERSAKRWDVVRTTNAPALAEALTELLNCATYAGGAGGIDRITARVVDDDARATVFEEAGFRPYTRETLFAVELPLGRLCQPEGVSLQRYRRGHAWSLQRLYNAATPPGVRSMEAMTATEFLRPFTGRRTDSVIAEAGSDVVAAAGSLRRSGAKEAVVCLLMQPGAVTAGEAALEQLLVNLQQHGVQTVWFPVRDYAADTLGIARRLGFLTVGARGVLVKHTTALIRQPVFSRLREAPATLPAVNGSRLVHTGTHAPQCRLHNDGRPRRRALPVSAQ